MNERQRRGRFDYVDDLIHVTGISKTMVDKFRGNVCVDGDDGSTEEVIPFNSGSTAEKEWRKCQGWITMAEDRAVWKRVCSAYLAQPKFK